MSALPGTQDNGSALLARVIATGDPLDGKLIEIVAGADGSLAVKPGQGASFTPGPSTPYSTSGALEASAVLKASAGTFRSLLVELDASAPTGPYYAQLLTGSATVPADGSVTHLRPPQRIDHINGTADRVLFDEGDAGITFTVGCTACLSATRWTKTLSGAYCTFAGSVL